MTQNEKKLLSVFLWMCVGIAFTFSVISGLDRLNSAILAESQFKNALVKIDYGTTDIDALKKKLKKLKEEQTEDTQTNEKISTADVTAYFRAALEKQGIHAKRYQITGTLPNESVEFIVQCKAIPFFTFLESEAILRTPVIISLLSVKPAAERGLIDVIFRVRHAK